MADKKLSSGQGLIFETWPLAKLVEYARNPRKNDHAVDAVAAAAGAVCPDTGPGCAPAESGPTR